MLCIHSTAGPDDSGLHQPTDPLKMLFINHLPVVRILQGICTELPVNAALYLPEQRLLYRLLHEQIIRRHTRLSEVQIFSEHDPACRQTQICRLIHNAGALSAQLQADRREIMSCLFHYKLPYRLTSGKKDKIKLLLQQLCILRSSAFYCRNKMRGKAASKQPGNHSRGRRRIGARLYDHTVACRNRTDHRL